MGRLVWAVEGEDGSHRSLSVAARLAWERTGRVSEEKGGRARDAAERGPVGPCRAKRQPRLKVVRELLEE